MDKKTGIIIGIISAVIVVLVAVVFVMDANMEKPDVNTVIIIEGVEYSKDEFETFAKIYNHEINNDINKQMTAEETDAMMSEFYLRKVYYTAALNNEVSGDTEAAATYEKDYAEDEAIFLAANVSKEDYIKYRTEQGYAETLQYNFSDYYTLPDDIYDSVKESFITENMYKTYTFRMMTIPYDAPTSGDTVSGDSASGDTVDVLSSGDEEDLSRDEQLKVAEDVLARIKSGEDFGELAKEYGSTRLSFKGNEIVLLNGDIEYATSPVLESKLGSKALYDAVLALESGDCTEVIDDTEYTSFQIVKLEGLEEGFVGEGEKELKEALLSEYANDIIAGNLHFEVNPSALMRMLYKK